MLAELYVENFALIEKLQVSFYEGFHIISGETGAGKSLLTDAVGLLLGGRADKGFIGKAAEKALVEGTFVGPFRTEVLSSFEAAGYPVDEEIVIAREIHEEGSNLCRINGRRVSLSVLKELVPSIMNLHSQAESISFLKEDHQIAVVDALGGGDLKEKKEAMAAAYSTYHKAHKERRLLEKQHRDAAEKVDFLEYRIKELSEMQLQSGEDCRLQEEISLMKSATKRLADAEELHSQLNSAVESLYEALSVGKRLGGMDESIVSDLEVLSSSYYDIEDLRNTVAQYRDQIEAEPYALEQAEERLSRLSRLKKKYNKDIDGLLLLLQDSEKELSAVTDFDYQKEQLEKAESAAYQRVIAAAEVLTEARKKIGKDLAEKITVELQDLMLPHASFETAITDGTLSANGKDEVSFLISMNRGEERKPLVKIASGGEISRILLAMKVILGKTDRVQTMIFDEIDSGMSGKAAAKVGEKLQLLAKDMQVFAVTHSPIVAAKADHHYHIEKMDFFDKTIVEISELKGEDIKKELARMLSGNEKSEVSLKQAEALLHS